MNERIEHCLYQAGLTAQGCWDELDDYAKEGIEKFAELIIRECVRQVDLDNGYGNNEWDRALTFVSKHLKEHFGVEE